MAEVTPLFGTFAAGQDTIPGICDALENLLAAARRGEIRSIAVAYIDGADTTCNVIRRGDKLYASLLGAVTVLAADLINKWHGD